ncbi:DnaJ-like cysteine-rich domain-containing protein [Kosakonia radicincitans]|uniref:hypothetical protein n=1 Tax=Kosakonia radicincitans TaxID=283686 RepID=UPI001D094DD2|nr:hypothetical protein [Kosakonia radicincitans]
MTNNDDLALKLKGTAERALASWNKFTSLPDDVDLECGLSLYEMSLLSAHDAASNPANILSLLAERTADKAENASLRQRVAELEKYAADRDAENQGLMLTVGRLRTEREARTVSVKLPEPFGFARRSGDLVVIDVNGDPHIKDGMPLYAALLSPSVTCSVCSGSGRLHEPNEEPGDCSLCNGTGLLAAGIKLEVEE